MSERSMDTSDRLPYLDRIHKLEEFRTEATIRLERVPELKEEFDGFKDKISSQIDCLRKQITGIDKKLYAATAVIIVFEFLLKYDLFKFFLR